MDYKVFLKLVSTMGLKASSFANSAIILGMSEYQDAETAQFYDRKMGDSGDAHHRLLLDPPMEALLPAADVGVLDVGSGNGYGTQRLGRKYRRVVGIDQSEELVKIASAKRQPGFDIQYRVVDIENGLPFSDKSLDRKSTRLNSSHGYISYAV